MHKKNFITKFTAVFLTATFILSALAVPRTYAAPMVDDPNRTRIESIANREVKIDPNPTTNPVPNGNIKIAGIWTVYLDNKAVGYSMPVKYLDKKFGKRIADFYNFLHANTLDQWVDVLLANRGFNIEPGDIEKARSNARKLLVRIYTTDGKSPAINENRAYIRYLTEVCGVLTAGYEPNKEDLGLTGKVFLETFPLPTGQIVLPVADGSSNNMPLYYIEEGKDKRNLTITIKGTAYATFSPQTAKATNSSTQYIKMSFDVDGQRIINGREAYSNQNTIKVDVSLPAGTHHLRLFVKDIVGRWQEYNMYIRVEHKSPDSSEGPVADPDGNLVAMFDIRVYGNDGHNAYYPGGKNAKAKTGDTIHVINRSYDNEGMYTRVYDELKRSSYRVAVSPPPTRETRYVYHNRQVKEDYEYAKMNTPKWYLPLAYTSNVPYTQAQQISFGAKQITQPYNERSYYYYLRPYRYVDRGEYIERTASSWERDIIGYDKEGKPIYSSWYKDYYTVKFWDSDTRWERYDKSQYIDYGRITPGSYNSKKYSDDKWAMESYPHYTMWIAMTITDYYTKTPTPYVETNLAYYYAPVRVYHNNKPVAYFNIVGNASALGEKIAIVDLSYDPDFDKIVEREWTINGQTFRDIYSLENYINNTLSKSPGTYELTLRVLDDPTSRYERLTPRWSEPYTRKIVILGKNNPSYVSYKAEIEFDRDYVYTQWIKNAELNVKVTVSDIGYWTWDNIGDKTEERFVPVKVTNILQPYHNIVRYTRNKDVMRIYPEDFRIISRGDNSFTYEAKFRYPKAGRPESVMVFPFEVEWFGRIETLTANVPVNAFNITLANPDQPDKTVFHKIPQRYMKVEHIVQPPKP